LQVSQEMRTFATVQWNEGLSEASHFVLIKSYNMINKDVIKTAVEEWLEKGDYFLVDVEMTNDDRIVIEIDHADGVWIEDCADLSRFLQEKFGEELGDYELEVGSAGIGQPFKVMEQYRNHVGKVVEVLQKDGIKVQGTLKSVGDDETFVVTIKEKQRQEGKKRPVLVDVDKAYAVADVKYCKYLLNFK
jgi:ribosome maturation factor RimP